MYEEDWGSISSFQVIDILKTFSLLVEFKKILFYVMCPLKLSEIESSLLIVTRPYRRFNFGP
jgi:hypothetical protein